ncbi:uncharacterized protein LOC143453468 [Clavelina lepadiformis]|uniref:uncharacterized protein LOC143453468 n=1 Tax=Clavelina lepadiformis TaxID=159417 RepID=UPI0040426DB5
MANKSRFCVQFSSARPDSASKIRILFNDSQPGEIQKIWKELYNTNAPKDVKIICENQSSYALNNPKDFAAFMAIAEDQYRIHPSKPMSVVLAISGDYYTLTTTSTSSQDSSPERHHNEETTNGFCNQPTKEEESPCSSGIKNLKISDDSPHNSSDHAGNSENSQERNHEILHNDHGAQDLSMKSNGHHKFDQVHRNGGPDQGLGLSAFPFYDKVRESSIYKNGFSPCQISSPTVSCAAANFVSNMQQQRLMGHSPSASFILQSFWRNNFERAAAMQLANGFNHSNGSNESLLAASLNDLRSLRSGGAPTSRDDDVQKKRKRPSKSSGNKKNANGTETSKRMRSSPSQSNIEYHYQRAKEYETMPEEQQKMHNSAHRSHWKHLLFVTRSSPNFVKTFKYAKYDEWSSEARDIFAISQPDKYRWSFLTISKQGDVLCDRIKGRIQDLKDMELEDKPEWCPPEEVLDTAIKRADTRLIQLRKIIAARKLLAEQNGDAPPPTKQRALTKTTNSRRRHAIKSRPNKIVLPPALHAQLWPACLPPKSDASPKKQKIKKESAKPPEK